MNENTLVKKDKKGAPSIFRTTAFMVFLVTIVVTIIVQAITHNFYTVYNMTTLLRRVVSRSACWIL